MFSQWLPLFCILISLSIDAAPTNRDEVDDLQNADKQRRWEQEQRRREEVQKEEIAKYVKYMRYLETVLNILQATPQWKEAMQSMTQEEMLSGKIAEMVDKLEPHIIEQLAKAKILELQRLEQEIRDQLDVDGGATHNIKIPEHLDFNNWETFSQEDLRKLVVKIVADMDELEQRRKRDFKQYEMKKAEEDHKMAQMVQTEREQYIQQMEEQRRRHNKHEPLKHPGSRNQLRKVWEDTDKLDKDAYDPTTLFGLHDRNDDGYWSYDELNTIFLPEIEKLNNFSDLERLEELYRMRDHVMKQMDTDGDHRISLAEFLADREAQEEKPDQGWEDIGDKEQYTKEELEIFEKEYAKQQGWGEYAYSTPAPTPGPSQMNHPDQKSVQKHSAVTNQLGKMDMKQPHQIPVQHVEPIQPLQQHQMDEHPIQHVDRTYGV
ncbi:EF hand family protein [Loa loa]|uniref:EF hand family protein n=1 Tax=Loa loa TaxID=7209 RepID=A0A1S0TNV2_LOALO|nr:EF hand family protein [Loa loa]EFO16668.2 EF hand family protein [Loa loa]